MSDEERLDRMGVLMGYIAGIVVSLLMHWSFHRSSIQDNGVTWMQAMVAATGLLLLVLGSDVYKLWKSTR